MTAPLDELREVNVHFPRFWSEAGRLFTETLYESLSLDRRTIELVLLALLAGKRWETGIHVHTEKALEHGATAEDVRSALLLSMAVFGTSAAVQALHWAEVELAAAADGDST